MQSSRAAEVDRRSYCEYIPYDPKQAVTAMPCLFSTRSTFVVDRPGVTLRIVGITWYDGVHSRFIQDTSLDYMEDERGGRVYWTNTDFGAQFEMEAGVVNVYLDDERGNVYWER